jgi:hypothetical protein
MMDVINTNVVSGLCQWWHPHKYGEPVCIVIAMIMMIVSKPIPQPGKY